jgi:hypothetical protein
VIEVRRYEGTESLRPSQAMTSRDAGREGRKSADRSASLDGVGSSRRRSCGRASRAKGAGSLPSICRGSDIAFIVVDSLADVAEKILRADGGERSVQLNDYGNDGSAKRGPHE